MSTIDENNPGLVEVEDEAYYPVVPGIPAVTGGPIVDVYPGGEDVASQGFASFGPNDPQLLPPTEDVDVGSQQAGPFLSLSATVGDPVPAEVDVNSENSTLFASNPAQAIAAPAVVNVDEQNAVRPNPASFIVTSNENFQTNLTTSSTADETVSSASLVDSSTNYQVFFGSANLFDFGVPLAGRAAQFATSGQTRIIISWGGNWILVAKTIDGVDLAAPVAGNHVTFAVDRQGAQAVVTYGARAADVNVSTSTGPVTQDPVGSLSVDGPVEEVIIDQVQGFIGSGVQTPPFVGDFNVADECQVVGLPVNVFPG